MAYLQLIDFEGMKVFHPCSLNMLADQDLQLREESPGPGHGGALFLNTGGMAAATEHLTSLSKQVLDDIPSTLGVPSGTGKHKLDSSDEPSSKILLDPNSGHPRSPYAEWLLRALD
ncbi:hypothetical protein F5146DRAFT_1142733 [Armillaria mellea]|nr:hypothetical protein F5146DRAFT_1142733 [Armillaria mellea]